MIYNLNYQKIKYQVTICKHSSQFFGEKIKWPPKNGWVFASFSWKSECFFEVFEKPRTCGSLNLILKRIPRPGGFLNLEIFIYLGLMVLWFWSFFKYPELAGIAKIQYLPHTGWNLWEPSQETCQRDEIYQHPSSNLFLPKISPGGDRRKEGSCKSYKGFFLK